MTLVTRYHPYTQQRLRWEQRWRRQVAGVRREGAEGAERNTAALCEVWQRFIRTNTINSIETGRNASEWYQWSEMPLACIISGHYASSWDNVDDINAVPLPAAARCRSGGILHSLQHGIEDTFHTQSNWSPLVIRQLMCKLKQIKPILFYNNLDPFPACTAWLRRAEISCTGCQLQSE